MEVRLDEGRRHQPALGVDLDRTPVGEPGADARDALAADADVHGPVGPRDARVPDHQVHGLAPFAVPTSGSGKAPTPRGCRPPARRAS